MNTAQQFLAGSIGLLTVVTGFAPVAMATYDNHGHNQGQHGNVKPKGGDDNSVQVDNSSGAGASSSSNSYGSQQGQSIHDNTLQGGQGGAGGGGGAGGQGFGGGGGSANPVANGGSSEMNGNILQGGQAGAGGSVHDNTLQGGSGYGGSGGTVGNTSAQTGPIKNTANGGNVGDITTSGGSADSNIKNSGNGTATSYGSTSSNSGNGFGGEGGQGYGGTGGSGTGGSSSAQTGPVNAQGGSAQTGAITSAGGTGGSSSAQTGNNTGGNLSITDNSKSTYRVPPINMAPIPGNPGSSTYQTLICLPNGQTVVTNNAIQGKSAGANITIPFVGGGFGFTSSSPSKNEAYYATVAGQAQTRMELMTADNTASHPLGQRFLQQHAQVATAMNSKALKLNDKQLIAEQKLTTQAVQATIAKSKKGSVAMGCGRVGGQQIFIDQQPQVPTTVPSVPTIPTVSVPEVPTFPGASSGPGKY